MATNPTVQLTVQSINCVNLPANSTQIFTVSRMINIIDNPNPTRTVTITEAGDTSTQMSAWDIAYPSYKEDDLVLYWGLFNNSTTRTVILWKDAAHNFKVAEGSAVISNSGSGTVELTALNMSGINASVLVSPNGAGVDDSDTSNTLTLNYAKPDTSALQITGATQFSYQTSEDNSDVYTVSESQSDILASINGTGEQIATLALTRAQILNLSATPLEIIAVPGKGKVIEFISGIINFDATSTAYATNLNPILINTTTTTNVLATATNGISGTTPKIVSFIKGAGMLVENEGVSVSIASGNPITGTGTGIVTVTYKITSI